MNSINTITERMAMKGLPYEMTECSPFFALTGATGSDRAVVAFWESSDGDTHRTYVGFYGKDNADEAARKAKAVVGVHSVAVVTADFA